MSAITAATAGAMTALRRRRGPRPVQGRRAGHDGRAATSTVIPAGLYEVDPAHSSVEFRVKHLGITSVRGQFDSFEGRLEVGEDLGSLKAHGTVDIASITDARQYPEIRFESKGIDPVDEKTFEMVGDLSLRGVTKQVALVVEVTGTEQDPYRNARIGLNAKGELRPRDWGMTFNQVLDSGNVLASAVQVELDITAVRRD